MFFFQAAQSSQVDGLVVSIFRKFWAVCGAYVLGLYFNKIKTKIDNIFLCQVKSLLVVGVFCK